MTINTKITYSNELSPCIRNCCLDTNDVCLGCYRTLIEITGWRDKSNNQKIEILAHCEQRRAQANEQRTKINSNK